MWQALRDEIRPLGTEIVTVALDVQGVEAARPWVERANATHPSLVDAAHVLDELLGIVNVPSGVWIDAAGAIVRPPETAYPHRPSFLDRPAPPGSPPHVVERVQALHQLRIDPDAYVAAVRDWAENGAASRYVLPAQAVLARSRPRPWEEAEAAAHFALAQHLYRKGRPEAAVRHFRAAHRLQPDNWTYKRQAWSLVDPTQGPTKEFEGDWLTDVKKMGAESYYPALDM